MTSKNNLSIWLVVGISLLVNGVLILGSGLYELAYPPANKVVLYEYHASIWWGAILTIVGAVYCYHFIPQRKAEDIEDAVVATAVEHS
jgi:hypothetical protein